MSGVFVNSSNLYSVGYDPSSLTLEIQFRNGDIYRHSGVAAVVHEGLMSARSHGSYFAQVIRDAYSYEQVA
jgi:hypothetical protein